MLLFAFILFQLEQLLAFGRVRLTWTNTSHSYHAISYFPRLVHPSGKVAAARACDGGGDVRRRASPAEGELKINKKISVDYLNLFATIINTK